MSTPPAVTTIADQVGRLFRLTKAWRSVHADPRLHPQGAAQMLLLPLHHHGAMRSQALADLTHADPSTISRHVSLLLNEGLIARQADQTDGRASLLVLTDKGHERVAEMREGRDVMIAGLLSDWSDTDVTRLAKLLDRFNDCFETALNDERHNLETA
ncbi:MAG TPA: MarR family transcriptional regulator [Mycobacteriales bacterium]|jgi:DNA-binding MarR family transcriptional regulator|nr:MarR family transcriptional regulator [Mycobacteriales bacterium]